ncbi:hypothetical protein BJY59DRAFT_302952 [Rhodotorula toruloides]
MARGRPVAFIQRHTSLASHSTSRRAALQELFKRSCARSRCASTPAPCHGTTSGIDPAVVDDRFTPRRAREAGTARAAPTGDTQIRPSATERLGARTTTADAPTTRGRRETRTATGGTSGGTLGRVAGRALTTSGDTTVRDDARLIGTDDGLLRRNVVHHRLAARLPPTARLTNFPPLPHGERRHLRRLARMGIQGIRPLFATGETCRPLSTDGRATPLLLRHARSPSHSPQISPSRPPDLPPNLPPAHLLAIQHLAHHRHPLPPPLPIRSIALSQNPRSRHRSSTNRSIRRTTVFCTTPLSTRIRSRRARRS